MGYTHEFFFIFFLILRIAIWSNLKRYHFRHITETGRPLPVRALYLLRADLGQRRLILFPSCYNYSQLDALIWLSNFESGDIIMPAIAAAIIQQAFISLFDSFPHFQCVCSIYIYIRRDMTKVHTCTDHLSLTTIDVCHRSL